VGLSEADTFNRSAGIDGATEHMINRVILCGHIGQYGCKISWTEQGKAQTSFTIVVEKSGFKTFIPVTIVGNRAEIVAETLEAGDLIMLEGSLSWRAGKTKDSGKLVVVAFDAERLMPASVESVN
jgi:single-stranded DNA-binding protein